MDDFLFQALRLLKGCPLSVLHALNLARLQGLGTVDATWLMHATDYSDKPVGQALLLLESFGQVERKSRYEWKLLENASMLPLVNDPILLALFARLGKADHEAKDSANIDPRNISESGVPSAACANTDRVSTTGGTTSGAAEPVISAPGISEPGGEGIEILPTAESPRETSPDEVPAGKFSPSRIISESEKFRLSDNETLSEPEKVRHSVRTFSESEIFRSSDRKYSESENFWPSSSSSRYINLESRIRNLLLLTRSNNPEYLRSNSVNADLSPARPPPRSRQPGERPRAR